MRTKANHQEFIDEILARNIQYLVHFTRFENITAIVGEGRILPRNQLHNIGFQWKELVKVNAPERWDDASYLNTSVMHPNVYLLNVFQKKWYPGSRFCVIGIDPSYIYEADTKFSVTNATYGSAIYAGIGGSIRHFRAMFGETVTGGPNKNRRLFRRSVDRQPYYTTDPEAEVLISCEIPYEDIMFVALRDQYEYDLLASAFDAQGLSEEKFCVEPAFFEFYT